MIFTLQSGTSAIQSESLGKTGMSWKIIPVRFYSKKYLNSLLRKMKN